MWTALLNFLNSTLNYEAPLILMVLFLIFNAYLMKTYLKHFERVLSEYKDDRNMLVDRVKDTYVEEVAFLKSRLRDARKK